MASTHERNVVRDLARRVAELASSDEYAARRKRWRDVNALRRPDRAPVWCKPVGCWGDLIPADAMECEDPELRGVEWALRTHLVKHEIGDDSLIPPYWPVATAIGPDAEHPWGVPIRREQSGEAGGAWKYDPPIREDADLDRLRTPHYVHDADETRRRLEQAGELFDGVLPVRRVCPPPMSMSLGNEAADLLGLDGLMMDLAARPDRVHRLMTFLRDAVSSVLDQVEELGVLTDNNTGEMYCSDPLTDAPPERPRRIGELWGHAESQVFQCVSPAMWREFLLDYQKPLLERFALCSYGCCEDLTDKTDVLDAVDNLRIFVSSAWTDLDRAVGACGDRYAIMWRQKASDVVYGDLGAIRRHLEAGCRRLQGCRYQIVLRELQTLAGNPRRLHEWAAIATEAAAKYA